MKTESSLVGIAGEYYVAAELSIRGFIAAVTLRNSRGLDIIASKSDGSKQISIQVKTNSGGAAKWILDKKAETFVSDSHYYVFVALKTKMQRPDFYIVPSKIVGEYVANAHKNWLLQPSKNGSPHNDNPVRNFFDKTGTYKEKWELLTGVAPSLN
jgi:hypothetical protein